MKSLLTILLSVLCLVANAQNISFPTLSPASTITQQVGLTEIKLSYSRPGAKGGLFSGDWYLMIKFGEPEPMLLPS